MLESISPFSSDSMFYIYIYILGDLVLGAHIHTVLLVELKLLSQYFDSLTNNKCLRTWRCLPIFNIMQDYRVYIIKKILGEQVKT